MNRLDLFLGLSLLVGLALPVLVLPWLAFLWRTRLAEPRCDRCRHRLAETGIPNLASCPECGRDLASNGVRYGHRSPRWWWAIGFPVGALSIAALASIGGAVRVGVPLPATAPATVDELIDRLRAVRTARETEGDWALHSRVGIGVDTSIPPESIAARRGEIADALLATLRPAGEPDRLVGAYELARTILEAEPAVGDEPGADRVRELVRRFAPDPGVRVRRRQSLEDPTLVFEVRTIPELFDQSWWRNDFHADFGTIAIRLADGRRIDWPDDRRVTRLSYGPGPGATTLSMMRTIPVGSRPPPGPATLELDPALTLPDWYTAWDIHVQPGGVWRNDASADIYELGAKLVMLGVNDDYIFHRAFVDTAVPERAYRRIVDLGCGFGKSTWPFKRRYPEAEVIGVDLAAPCLAMAAEKASAQGLAIRFLQADCARTGLPAGSADLVTSTMLIHEMPRPHLAATLREAARLLAPGGVLRFLDFTYTGQTLRDAVLAAHGLRNNEPFMPGSMRADIGALCRDAGLAEARWVAFDERGRGRLDGREWPERRDWHFPWAVLEAHKPS